MKKWLQEYFKLSNREWNGFLVLIAIFISIQAFLTFQFYNAPVPDFDLKRIADQKLLQQENGTLEENVERAFIYVNHPSEAELESHKLPGYVIKNWLNYISKGGRFKSVPDLKKLYGMNDSLYNYLLPYLLEEENEGRKDEYSRAQPYRFRTDTATLADYKQLHIPIWLAERIFKFGSKRNGFSVPAELYAVYGFDSSYANVVIPYLIFNDNTEAVERFDNSKGRLVNLNLADSMALLSVKGIGPSFASRIIKYRTRLGGFVLKEQLLEVYGIDQDRYPQIATQVEVTDTLVTKINVNTADFSTLVKHPYITKELTLLILNFREEIRDFQSVDEVFKLGLMTQEEFHKLAPYLIVK